MLRYAVIPIDRFSLILVKGLLIVKEVIRSKDFIADFTPPTVYALRTSVAPFQFVTSLKYKCGYVISA